MNNYDPCGPERSPPPMLPMPFSPPLWSSDVTLTLGCWVTIAARKAWTLSWWEDLGQWHFWRLMRTQETSTARTRNGNVNITVHRFLGRCLGDNHEFLLPTPDFIAPIPVPKILFSWLQHTIGSEWWVCSPQTPNWDPRLLFFARLPPVHSEYLCLSWPRASSHQELHGVWLFCGEQTFPSPPSWKKPQKQSLSQLQSKGPVFTLLRHSAALWPRTQATKPLWGFPEVPRSRAAG